MNRRQFLSQKSNLDNFSQYVGDRARSTLAADANPAALGLYDRRDPETGQIISRTPGGGRLRSKSLSSGAIPKGSVVPQLAIGRRGTGFSDTMPAK